MQRTKLSFRRVGVLLLTLCLSQTNGFSQIMPSLPDLFASPVNNYGNPSAPTVNCDMLETGEAGTLKDNSIDIQTLPSGNYFLKIVQHSKTITTQFIKR